MALDLFNRFNQNSEHPEMSFIDHLEALRWHIVRSVLAIVVIAILIFIKIDWIFEKIIAGPLNKDFITFSAFCKLGHLLHMGDSLCMQGMEKVQLQSTTFSSQFISSITVAFVCGFIVAFPYVFWEFWRFVKPALSPKELKSSRGAIFWVTFFFLLGIAFGYLLLAPFSFTFLFNYKLGLSGLVQTKPTLDDYLDNFVDILITCGLTFQLPIISHVLTSIGLITPSFLRNYRKYSYVAILFIAAIITPSGDMLTQSLVSLPLILLYEVSILISARVMKQRDKKDKEEWS
jgi:sec-independent protein translocase protein TatC